MSKMASKTTSPLVAQTIFFLEQPSGLNFMFLEQEKYFWYILTNIFSFFLRVDTPLGPMCYTLNFSYNGVLYPIASMLWYIDLMNSRNAGLQMNTHSISTVSFSLWPPLHRATAFMNNWNQMSRGMTCSRRNCNCNLEFMTWIIDVRDGNPPWMGGCPKMATKLWNSPPRESPNKRRGAYSCLWKLGTLQQTFEVRGLSKLERKKNRQNNVH